MRTSEAVIASKKSVVRKFPDWLDRLHPRLFLDPTKKLTETHDVEIENAFKIDPKLQTHLEGYFVARKFKTSSSTANSLYLDTLDLDLLFKSLLSLRDRAGGMGSDGTVYQSVYGIKYKDEELQKVIDEIIQRIYPSLEADYPSEDIWAYVPLVRSEVERSHEHPHDAAELRLSDFPKDLQEIIKLALGKREARELVVKPVVNTVVERNKFMVYVDTSQFLKGSEGKHGALSFEDLPLYAEPTEEMKRADNYICLELAFDKIQNQKPRKGTRIRDILDNLETNKKSVCQKKVKFVRMEYEYVREKSGAQLEDNLFTDVYTRFGLAIKTTDKKIKKEFAAEAEKIRNWIDMKPAVSKAAAAAHALDRRCSGKRRFGRKYKKNKLALP